MIIVLEQNPEEKQLDSLKQWLNSMDINVQTIEGIHSTVLGLVGDTSTIDIEFIGALDIVADVKRIQEPYKQANRRFHPLDTIISIGDVKIGGGNFAMIAGPCAVESHEQICMIASSVKSSGAAILRGGAFKPRTSPYAFQGLRADGIELMLEAKKEIGLPIISEIMDISQLPLFDNIDIIQVGARNMHNFELLKALGKINKPVLLKRGFSATIQELLMSAEYIMAGGNEEVILCERGIRTFETTTRNTLDLASIPVLKELTHLPVVIDPSHSTGYAKYVKSMSLAAVAAGADGLIIEVHNDPANAMCDGQQSITPEAFSELSAHVNELLPIINKFY
ncbi:2-keto-3-deoxy-D-arabino-heptulosonate-7-phosphate synthase I beta [Candidatus Syntrophocurvum alkaliphilum]|uniref:2-keto-3-deoxy-D-arabino-heptulosonate-7-phosphate synthase I beta n=1 Tax=Candidatus Syntrophocurvum alkaliphilum TaxID=2293317 RepID=A0A6I6D8R1_9FIRM|nr:3-deoxy-7-phosphoheptulonate synthase [Candidatus Syntrophocurvum alkaliphilum]QGT99338.1 2-keto-3-deoxy-D-arabino-heptulosonate-7-phosphate synthase I beta [Candidatus Syntrophocurvum alkaliphilum]